MRGAASGRGSDRERGGRRWRDGGGEGNLQGELEPLSSRGSWVRDTEVSSSDRRGRAVSILPIIVGLKGYLKKACIANSSPTWPISYGGENGGPLSSFILVSGEEKATCTCYRRRVERRPWVRNFARCFGDFGNSREKFVLACLAFNRSIRLLDDRESCSWSGSHI